MTESEYFERMAQLWPEGEESPSDELMTLSSEAVQTFPDSPEFLCIRGHLIELSLEDSQIPLTDALACYRKAAEIDPQYPEAWESIGYYLGNHNDDLNGAEESFRKAIEVGGDADSYIGLARVLAEKGQKDAAVKVLSAPTCPFADEEDVEIARQEIEEGQSEPS